MGRTSSPSSTNVLRESDRRFATTSGKNRDSDLPDFALISTSSPDLNARQRNPSHLGSNCQPGPSAASRHVRASIGSSDKGTPSKPRVGEWFLGAALIVRMLFASCRSDLGAITLMGTLQPSGGGLLLHRQCVCRHLVGDDLKDRKARGPITGRDRNVGSVAAGGHQDAANAGAVVAGVERVPAAA